MASDEGCIRLDEEERLYVVSIGHYRQLCSPHRIYQWQEIYFDLMLNIQAYGNLWWLSSKDSTCNAGDASSIPASGGSPGVGNGHPLQHSYLGNPTDRGAWQAIVSGVAKESDKT